MTPAGYTCWGCDHKWSQPLGPSVGWTPEGEMIHIDAPPSGCPRCGHPYMTCDRFAPTPPVRATMTLRIGP